MEDKKVILEVKDLKKYFPLGKGKLDKNKKYVKAVDGVSFKLYEGETLGLVGESGCGKSTLGRAILRLHEPTSGEVHFNGEDILKKNRKEMRKLREEMQIIFQDPYSSLNPRMNVYNILSEPLVAHGYYKKGDELKQYILNLMEKCGLPPYYCYRYPHQFSGGQRQRIGIARSLALDPSFIVCDEPVSALDVSIQSQIINLMMDMQEERKISYIFISHDLSVVKHISNRVGVMYLGSLVELAYIDVIQAAFQMLKQRQKLLIQFGFGKKGKGGKLLGALNGEIIQRGHEYDNGIRIFLINHISDFYTGVNRHHQIAEIGIIGAL